MVNLRQVVEGMYVGKIDLNGQLALDSVLEVERRLSVLAYGSLRVKLSDANRTLTCLTSALRRAAGCSQRSPVDLWRVSFAKNWSTDADGRHRQVRCLVTLEDTTAVRLERRSVRRSAALKSWKQTRSWRLVNPCLANSSRCQTPNLSYRPNRRRLPRRTPAIDTKTSDNTRTGDIPIPKYMLK